MSQSIQDFCGSSAAAFAGADRSSVFNRTKFAVIPARRSTALLGSVLLYNFAILFNATVVSLSDVPPAKIASCQTWRLPMAKFGFTSMTCRWEWRRVSA